MKIATPKDSALEFLRDEGIIAPDEIPSEDDAVPLNFTRLNSRQLGAVHSRYAVRYSHAIYVSSIDAARLGTLQRNLKLEKAKYRVLHQDDYKTKYELDDVASQSKRIAQIETKIVELEARLEIRNAVAQGYESLRNAASREMFRRSSEKAPND